jgi:Zn-dependent protease
MGPGVRVFRPAVWAVPLPAPDADKEVVLAHEYAHARTAQHYGVRVRSITLWLLGGVSELDGDPPRPRADLTIALAGPAASLITAGLCLLAAGPAGLLGADLARVGFSWLAMVNGVLALFNLLPGAPLDGGRALAAILWRIRGDRAAAQQTAARAGMTLGTLMAAAGLVLTLVTGTWNGLWLALLGWYLSGTARAEAATLRFTGSLGDIPVGRLMSAPAICGYTGQTVAAFTAVVAAEHPHRCYPVVDLDGNLAGMVTVAGLTRIPPPRRYDTRLGEIVISAHRIPVAQRETPLRDPSALPTGPVETTVVVDGRRPCGVLTAGDLRRALAVAVLGETPDRSPGAFDDLRAPS